MGLPVLQKGKLRGLCFFWNHNPWDVISEGQTTGMGGTASYLLRTIKGRYF
jgi:hypothetical protein